MAPTIPRRVVLIRPMDCAPGMTARATRPTTKPTIMCQMMCSIGFLRLDGARVHGQVTSDHHFHRALADWSKTALTSSLCPHCRLRVRLSPGERMPEELAPAVSVIGERAVPSPCGRRLG